jgi:hypothetical protein
LADLRRGKHALMEWVERAPIHGPAFAFARPAAQPVFVDPHGHRVRRLRHTARVVAMAAAVYLALLALGLAGPASAPFSLFPGAKAGESGTEAVHTGSGAVTAAHVNDPRVGSSALTGGLGGLAPGGPGVAPVPGADGSPAAPAATPAALGATPAAQGASGAPATTPAGQTSAAPNAAPAPSGRSGAPSGSGSSPRSTPPPSSPSSSSQGQGPPAGHVPPGQAKKAPGGPPYGNGNGNGPPANHGQEMAAQHSHSPNH